MKTRTGLFGLFLLVTIVLLGCNQPVPTVVAATVVSTSPTLATPTVILAPSVTVTAPAVPTMGQTPTVTLAPESSPTAQPSATPTSEPTVTPTPLTLKKFIEMTEDQVPDNELAQLNYERFVTQFTNGAIEKNYDGSYSLVLSYMETHFEPIQLTDSVTMLAWTKARFFDANGVEQIVILPAWFQMKLANPSNTNGGNLTAFTYETGGGYGGFEGILTNDSNMIKQWVNGAFDIQNEMISSTFSQNPINLIADAPQQDIYTELLASYPTDVNAFIINGDISNLPTVKFGDVEFHLYLPIQFSANSYNRPSSN